MKKQYLIPSTENVKLANGKDLCIDPLPVASGTQASSDMENAENLAPSRQLYN